MPVQKNGFPFLPMHVCSSSMISQPSISVTSVKGNDNAIYVDFTNHDRISKRESALMPPWDPQIDKVLRAVESRSYEKLKTFLKDGININGHGGSFCITPLHQAAIDAWVDGVRFLMENGSSVSSKNTYGQTPLHYAAAIKSEECIRLLLGANDQEALNCQDKRGHTPLHDAASAGFLKGVNCLLKSGAEIKRFDNSYETPLHKAAKARSVACMMALLNAGACLDDKHASGETVMSVAFRHFPGGMDLLFDNCIVADPKKMRKKDLEVVFNYLPLASHMSEDSNQMRILQSLVEYGHESLLTHIVCETFLLIKWRKVRYLFFIEVIFYFLYAILTTVLCLNKFVWDEDWTNENVSINETINESLKNTLLAIVLFQAAIICMQQIMTALRSGFAWLLSLWNVLHFMIAVLVILVLPPIDMRGVEKHFCTLLLLLLWTQCMLLIGRFPNCGIYVVMFQRVAKVFLRIFAIYFCLLLAFTFSFYVSMHKRKCVQGEDQNCSENGENAYIKIETNSDVFLMFMKTLIMMIGELNFDNEMVGSMDVVPYTSRIVFLLFVILVAIILSNLLVALAVNDVQALRSSVHLERLIKQLELVYQMEENFRTVASVIIKHKITCKNDVLNFCRYDCKNSKVSTMPHNVDKSRRLRVKSYGVIDEIKIKRELAEEILGSLQNRDIDSKDRTTSLSVRRNRRADYSNSDDLRGNLEQLETNLVLKMSEKLENFTTVLTNLNARIDTIEDIMKNLSSNETFKRNVSRENQSNENDQDNKDAL